MKLFAEHTPFPKNVTMPQPQYLPEEMKEDKAMVEAVRDSYERAAWGMKDEFRELRELGDLFIGRAWTDDEKKYLDNLGRVARTYNMALPHVIAVEGVFINNKYRLRCYPRYENAVDDSELHTKVLNYFLDEAGYDRQNLRAFSDSLIFRRGWKSWSWERTGRHPDGQLVVRRLNPFDVLFDADNGEVDVNRGRFIIFTRFFTAERIRQLYAGNNPELSEYIDRNAQNIEGPMYKKRRQRSLAHKWRERSGEQWTKNKKWGFGDDDADPLTGGQHPTTDYYDSQTGLYRLIEFHERRSADNLFIVYDRMRGGEIRIPHEYEDDRNWIALQVQKLGLDTTQERDWKEIRELPEYWVTAVAPKLSPEVVLMERPYTVQDPQQDLGFAIVGQSAYDQHPDKGKHLGLMDQVRDSQLALNRNMSTREDVVTRMLNPDVIGSAEAFADFPDDFFGPESRKVGAVRRIGKLDDMKGFPQYMYPNASVAQLLDFNTDWLMGFAERATGINANLQGRSQSSGESGVLDAQRTERSEIMLQGIYENMRYAQERDGQFAHSLIVKHARAERWITIAGPNNQTKGMYVNQWDFESGGWNNKLSEAWSKYSIRIDREAKTRTERESKFREGLVMLGTIQDPRQRTAFLVDLLELWDHSGADELIESMKKTILFDIGPHWFLPFDLLLEMQLEQMGLAGVIPNLLPGQTMSEDGSLPGTPGMPGMGGGAPGGGGMPGGGGNGLGIQREMLSGPTAPTTGNAVPRPGGEMETGRVRDHARIPIAEQGG